MLLLGYLAALLAPAGGGTTPPPAPAPTGIDADGWARFRYVTGQTDSP